MFEHRAFQWWYGGRDGLRRAAFRCLLACALVVSARSASAFEEPVAPLFEPVAPLCDPDAVASGVQIECEDGCKIRTTIPIDHCLTDIGVGF